MARAYERARMRVVAAILAESDPVALRLRALAEIRSVVPFDAYVWVLTDPETSVGSAPLADVPAPLLGELPRLIRLKYLTEVNRWTSIGVASLRAGGDPARSRLWRELLQEHGVVDVASAALRDRFGCWGFLDLWRRDRPFEPDEIAFLRGLVEPVTRAVRRSQAELFVSDPPAPAPPSGPVVMLLSPGLEVLDQTAETAEYLRALVPPSAGRAPVPAGAYNVGAQLLAREAGIDDHPARARVHLANGVWLTLGAARLGGPEIAVTIGQATPGERLSLFGRAFGLTAREAELLAHLMSGTDTRELARRLGVSEHTVQDHLKSVFAKTATRSRSGVLSRALGTA